jgi:hypothetical protein
LPVGLGLVAVLILAGGISLFWSHADGAPSAAAASPPATTEQPPEPAAPPDTNPLHL